jgi:PDZ domain-containing secreted protein/Zn-dependent protease/predicted transcriptional regulator
MERTLTLFRVRGIPVGINWSWLPIAMLLVWVLGSALFPRTHPGLEGSAYLVMAVAAVLLFFGSVLLHELAHALVGLRAGVRIEGITLWLLGGVARFTGGVPSPGVEFRMTVVGPFTSLALAGAFGGLGYLGGALDWPVAVLGVLEYLGRINLILAAFNLVPAMPLDGGRVLRSWLWHRQGSFAAATRSAARAGRAFGFLLVWVGVLGLFTGTGLGGLWLVILGWFLLQAAVAEESGALVQETFRGRRVRDVMSPEPSTVEPQLPLDAFLERAGRPHGHSTYPVVLGDRLVGLVSLRMASTVPPHERPFKVVRDVMLPTPEVPTVGPDEPVADALEVLQGPVGRVVVVEEGDRVVGVLSLSDVARALELARARGEPMAAPARRAGPVVWVVVALAMAAAVGYLYHPPLAVLSPGRAVDVVGDIQIRGVEVHPVNGRYLMVPVRISRPNAIGALLAAFDPNQDVVPISAAFPVGDPNRIGQEQRDLLRESQMLAAASAATAVGMPVALDGSGARVLDVIPGSPAAEVLRPDDVIVGVDGSEIRLASELREMISARPAGTTFTLAVERGGLRTEVRVRSVILEEGEGLPAIGVVADTRGLHAELPFEISFRDRRVGGASAGLAYALAIVDLLGGEDLAAGRDIAATGVVDAEGSVGPVGGMAVKVASARTAGADLLFVPREGSEEIGPAGGLEVVRVGTLEEALASLRASA